ncbi:hypothetical protein KOY48_05450 [Candidatus Minimicrobia naudis]|uniref:Uncharacterized protein n=1 Tax=Candidatus Minimicrobia naudis TaxID=2841263 RepID=A0A8F1MB96_9BACT|nr:hypothetical protein KOY48_05450 [Candidatus Minimicrobia naudis]
MAIVSQDFMAMFTGAESVVGGSFNETGGAGKNCCLAERFPAGFGDGFLATDFLPES